MVRLLLFFVQHFRHQHLNKISDKNSFVIVPGQLKSNMHPLIHSNELWGDMSDIVCCHEQNLQTALQAVFQNFIFSIPCIMIQLLQCARQMHTLC
jgi:hypothetical protein